MIVLYGVASLWVASAALCVIGLFLAARNPMPEAVEARNSIGISRAQREFEPQTIVNHPVDDPVLANVKGST
jgi:hypothetical protein